MTYCYRRLTFFNVWEGILNHCAAQDTLLYTFFLDHEETGTNIILRWGLTALRTEPAAVSWWTALGCRQPFRPPHLELIGVFLSIHRTNVTGHTWDSLDVVHFKNVGTIIKNSAERFPLHPQIHFIPCRSRQHQHARSQTYTWGWHSN